MDLDDSSPAASDMIQGQKTRGPVDVGVSAPADGDAVVTSDATRDDTSSQQDQLHDPPPPPPQHPPRKRAPIACRRTLAKNHFIIKRRLHSSWPFIALSYPVIRVLTNRTGAPRQFLDAVDFGANAFMTRLERPVIHAERLGWAQKIGSTYPTRGEPDLDRGFRKPRTKASSGEGGSNASKKSRNSKPRRRTASDVAGSPQPSSGGTVANEWDLLPPLSEITEAVHLFTHNYFQLGFIHETQFQERLEREHQSVCVFLLLGILSISARFSATLSRRYGGAIEAADLFMRRAQSISCTQMGRPLTLEKCQAFYLLSLAQQGSDLIDESYINLGIATRMAVRMSLHTEEWYDQQREDSTQHSGDRTIWLESARRTLWMLHSQDNLHCGVSSPTSLSAAEITCLLPSNEVDFANGREPQARAALEDTPSGREDLIHHPARSLFATLIQIHYYWGKVVRKAKVSSRSPNPLDPASEYSLLAEKLRVWEKRLPEDHQWHGELLASHKARNQDLAYTNVTMMTRLCNVVLRRPYLYEMINPDRSQGPHRAFFSEMANELFHNVNELYEQIHFQSIKREADENVGAQMASFCIYSCGICALYLRRYNHICSNPNIAGQGNKILQGCMDLLMESKQVWPLAGGWLEELQRFSRDPEAAAIKLGGMADAKKGLGHDLAMSDDRDGLETRNMTPSARRPPSERNASIVSHISTSSSTTTNQHDGPATGLVAQSPFRSQQQMATPPQHTIQSSSVVHIALPSQMHTPPVISGESYGYTNYATHAQPHPSMTSTIPSAPPAFQQQHHQHHHQHASSLDTTSPTTTTSFVPWDQQHQLRPQQHAFSHHHHQPSAVPSPVIDASMSLHPHHHQQQSQPSYTATLAPFGAQDITAAAALLPCNDGFDHHVQIFISQNTEQAANWAGNWAGNIARTPTGAIPLLHD